MPLHVTDLLVDALSQAGVAIEGARVAVLGYAYLENSDDTRNSPSAVLVARLRELGAQVVVHDPYVPEYKSDLEKVVQGCDAVALMVAHDVYRSVDLEDLKLKVACPILIDGRHVFSMRHAQTAGWDYYSVGLGRE
jgi:UDP-N-acetyl-D-mannosaminuronic acid dehydrogenase